MFRKSLIIGVLMVLAAAVLPAQNVSEMDGYDWKNMHETSKVYYIAGFLSSLTSVQYMIAVVAEQTEEGITPELVEAVNKAFYLEGTVEQLMVDVNAYYHRTGDLETPIWRVVLRIRGKDIGDQ